MSSSSSTLPAIASATARAGEDVTASSTTMRRPNTAAAAAAAGGGSRKTLQQVHDTLTRTEALIASTTALAHPPWIEQSRLEKQAKLEKERQAEQATGRQWISKQAKANAACDDDDDEILVNSPPGSRGGNTTTTSSSGGSPAKSKEAIQARLRLRLMMGQSSEIATKGLPLPDVKNSKGGAGYSRAQEGGENGSNRHNNNNNNNHSTTPGAKRAFRRASLMSGLGMEGGVALNPSTRDSQGMTRYSSSSSSSAAAGGGGGHIPLHQQAGTVPPPSHYSTSAAALSDEFRASLAPPSPMRRPGSSRSSPRSRPALQGALDAAMEGEVGFTGMKLGTRAPLHTRYLEELRRHVNEAGKSLASKRTDLLNTIDTISSPTWRPLGRVRMIQDAMDSVAAKQAAEAAAAAAALLAAMAGEGGGAVPGRRHRRRGGGGGDNDDDDGDLSSEDTCSTGTGSSLN